MNAREQRLRRMANDRANDRMIREGRDVRREQKVKAQYYREYLEQLLRDCGEAVGV